MSQVSNVSLTNLAVVELKGGQPDKLLQGQLTCDLRLLSEQQSVPGLLCDLKGRVVCSLQIFWLAADHYLLVLPADTWPFLQAHLQKFLPFYRSSLTEVTEGWQLLGVFGRETPALLLSLMDGWPKAVYQQVISAAGIVSSLPGTRVRALVLLRRDPAGMQVYERLLQLTEPADLACWQLLNIQAGQLVVDRSLSGQYLPQMLNYQAQGLISFNKGCYVGQEIVARAQYRGQVKKRLYRACLACDGVASPAEVVDERGEVQGHVLQSAPDRKQQTEVLVLLKVAAVEEEQPLFVVLQEVRIKLTLLQLPYEAQARITLQDTQI